MMDTYSIKDQNQDTLWLQMKAKVKETRSAVFRHGARVPSSFCLWSPPQNVHNGHQNGGNFDQQILFLCMEEPITERW